MSEAEFIATSTTTNEDQKPELTTGESNNLSLDFSIKFDLEKVIEKYSASASWNETSRKTFSDFLHHFLIYVLMNRGENQRKVFTLKTSSEGEASIIKYMKEHTPESIERAQLNDPDNYTSGDLFEEITKENVAEDLKPFAHSESIKAIYKFTDRSNGEQPVTHQVIHLSFDFEQVKEFILEHFEFHQDVFCREVSLTCICAGFSALLEYIAAEIIELSGRFTEEKVLTVAALQKGLQSDPALSSLPCSHIILAQLP
ncbi:predicted protein [Naegleria gruberi]|uniref:Predicted protein n=1 Tax=Naegleria gruberi TaxID=5762 RepID=D2VGN2_NAEGR|nr:uncharacterized protein NAEGRDRAFT_68038 [Naegleria gruberi]EFC44093.1 predicted protein [Naegleria gruberi]|eukprot:XP_002676837.1 predicted protein [Naegleria gruberi strain NEG-M]